MLRRLGVIFIAVTIVGLVEFHPYQLAVMGTASQPHTVEAISSGRTIKIEGDNFTLNGRPLHIVSGSLHYFRAPAQYWRDRLRKLKAVGFNAVATYVEWSHHEPEERQYRFSGDYDVAQFVRLAAEEGLHVLLRPGPYICAERDLGGLPYWLLSKGIRLRSTDGHFIEEMRIWFAKLFEYLAPLLNGNGGPIILVQVENEYGSYNNDMRYKVLVRDALREHVRDNALLYTTDGTLSSMIRDGAVPGALTTIDFGVDQNLQQVFKPLRSFMPEGPLMNSEFYPGWLTHWGETFATVDTSKVVKSLEDMIKNKINVNMYLFFGGTNFEFTAGANVMERYVADITSYDYDAPLSEAGDPTPKYYAIRELMEKYNPDLKNITPPVPSPKGNYGPVTLKYHINLLSMEGRSKFGKRYNDVTGKKLPTFEALHQRSGFVLYETQLNSSNGLLSIANPRDRIYVYVDERLQGILDRSTKKSQLTITSGSGSILSLLVENQGRVNYGPYLHDYKGIIKTVKLDNEALSGQWTITGYPLEEVDTMLPKTVITKKRDVTTGPVVYEGEFLLPEGQKPLDTFIDPTGWGKGYVWVNGHNLGRYWPTLGPQVTLYVPGVWLRERNQIIVLELEQTPPSSPTITFIDYPILNKTTMNGPVTLYVPGVWLRGRNQIIVLELEQTPPSSPTMTFIDYPILNKTTKNGPVDLHDLLNASTS